jgi:energy-coupling factor transporter ATP-binding protein EcfA2
VPRARYNRETLEVHFKGRSIAEVLDMPIEEAVDFFEAIPAISRHLRTLVEVGLGYVRLGQPAPTLSGGEAQRVKLASELQKRSTGSTVYVLDEPTTGLHFEDTRRLLGVLQSLVDKGNTVIVIEHNLDVIKTADWLIDMGSRGRNARRHCGRRGNAGSGGRHPDSFTGQFLRPLLNVDPPEARPEASAGRRVSPRRSALPGRLRDPCAPGGKHRRTRRSTAPQLRIYIRSGRIFTARPSWARPWKGPWHGSTEAPRVHRRTLLRHAGGGLLAASWLVACGARRSRERVVLAAASSRPAPVADRWQRRLGGGRRRAAAARRQLAATADVAVGGGVIVADKYVITQPVKGEFKAFSAICTHQGARGRGHRWTDRLPVPRQRVLHRGRFRRQRPAESPLARSPSASTW